MKVFGLSASLGTSQVDGIPPQAQEKRLRTSILLNNIKDKSSDKYVFQHDFKNRVFDTKIVSEKHYIQIVINNDCDNRVVK